MGSHNIQIVAFEELRSPDPRKRDQALSQLVSAWLPKISSMIKKNGGQQQDADDIFQEAIVVFYEKIREGQIEISNPFNYFYGICKNLWLRRWSKAQRLPLTSNEHYDIEDVKEELADPEQMALVEEMINHLTTQCKQILTFFYFDKMTMSQIAQYLDYANEDSVKSKKYKCLSTLREMVLNKWNKQVRQ